MADKIRRSRLDRWLSHVDKREDGHWIWTGYGNKYGHGTFRWDTNTRMSAHRAGYKLLVDPDLSDNLVVAHQCKYPACVNPDCVEPKTQKENLAESSKTLMNIQIGENGECRNGHNEWSKPNYKTGKRRCLVCKRNYRRRNRGAPKGSNL